MTAQLPPQLERFARSSQLSALYQLTARLQRAATEPEIHEAALDAIVAATGCVRASILLFDDHEVMRFEAWRGLSDDYRRAVEGHTPWKAGDMDATPFAIEDLDRSDLDESLKATIRREGIGSLAFVPLIGTRRLVGKFMMYHDVPHPFPAEQLEIALAIGAHVALGVERCRAERALRDSEGLLAAEADALGRLNTASSRLWSTTSLSEGLEIVLTAAIELLGADYGNIQLDAGGVLKIAVQRGFRGIDDVETEVGFAPHREIAREAGFRTVQSTPLVARDGRVLGMISTHWISPHLPSDQDLRRLDLYARQASDFIERCEADDRLRQREASLRESDRRKDEFIAMLSHELRNPLAPLRSGLEIMRLDRTPDSVMRVQAMMERQVAHLVRLVDDLLESSRISRGLLQLRRSAVPVAEVLKIAIEASQPLLDECGHRLEIEIPDEPTWVDADSVRLAQCFTNLLNNAARYTPPTGRIGLRVIPEGQRVRIIVRDTGAGFPAGSRYEIFEMFARGPDSTGLGVGLALVSKLVAMHGGTVEAHSEGEGRGAEFTVTLPVSEAVPAVTRAEPTSLLTGSLRVVVADDNRDAADSLALLLGAAGHDVKVAGDGAEAITIAREFQAQVLVLDIGMPRLDGLAAAGEIRRDPELRGIRLIAVTGWGQEHDRRRAREAGFDAHLVKPVDLGALLSVLAGAPVVA